MGVAGTRRSIIFNDLLFFWVGGGGESRARTRMGREEQDAKRNCVKLLRN